MSYWGRTSLKRQEGVYPYLVECAALTVEDCNEVYGFDLTIPWLGGVRTAIQQNDAYKRKASKCDGYQKLSYHQIEATPQNPFGMALDIRPVGWLNMDKKQLDKKANLIGRLMLINWQRLVLKYALEEEIDIGVMVWGGTFGATSWDRPHFEVRI